MTRCPVDGTRVSNVTPLQPHKAKGRSRVSNGNRTLAAGDERSTWARRFKDLVHEFEADQGDAPVSEAKRVLMRAAATLTIQLEAMTADAAQGKPFDTDLFGRSAGNLRRLLEAVGLDRFAKDVTTDHVADHFSRPPARGGA